MPAYNTLTEHANAFGQTLTPESGLCLLCVRRLGKYVNIAPKGVHALKTAKQSKRLRCAIKMLKFFRNISPFYKKYLVRADKRTKSNKKAPAKQCRCFL